MDGAESIVFRLDLSYDGTDFSGWQSQGRGRTVQDTLEQALARMFKHAVRTRVAGRTDAGVHAAHQVVSFQARTRMVPDQVVRGANALLPPDVRAIAASLAPGDWDPRKASCRTYHYRFLNSAICDPLRRRYVWWFPGQLDLAEMDVAARQLEGFHDFSAFRSIHCDAPHARREIFSSSVTRKGDEILYAVSGWAFLRHMIRIVVGTLVRVGQGQLSPEGFGGILGAGRRDQAGETAPAQGLTLMRIDYDQTSHTVS